MQFNLRLKLCVALFQLPWELRLYDASRWWLLAVRRHPKLFPQSANELHFLPVSREDKLSGGGCSRNVSCGRSRMVNWSWRDRSWQQHSLGHEHKLPRLRNQPIVPTLSLPLKFIGITWNYTPNNCLLQQQKIGDLVKVKKMRFEGVEVEAPDTWSDKSPEVPSHPVSLCTGGEQAVFKEQRRHNEASLVLSAGNCSADVALTLLHTHKALLTLHHLFTALLPSKDDHRGLFIALHLWRDRALRQMQDTSL